MGKTRDLFKKIGDTKGRDGQNKGQNIMDLTKAEDIKQR